MENSKNIKFNDYLLEDLSPNISFDNGKEILNIPEFINKGELKQEPPTINAREVNTYEFKKPALTESIVESIIKKPKRKYLSKENSILNKINSSMSLIKKKYTLKSNKKDMQRKEEEFPIKKRRSSSNIFNIKPENESGADISFFGDESINNIMKSYIKDGDISLLSHVDLGNDNFLVEVSAFVRNINLLLLDKFQVDPTRSSILQGLQSISIEVQKLIDARNKISDQALENHKNLIMENTLINSKNIKTLFIEDDIKIPFNEIQREDLINNKQPKIINRSLNDNKEGDAFIKEDKNIFNLDNDKITTDINNIVDLRNIKPDTLQMHIQALEKSTQEYERLFKNEQKKLMQYQRSDDSLRKEIEDLHKKLRYEQNLLKFTENKLKDAENNAKVDNKSFIVENIERLGNINKNMQMELASEIDNKGEEIKILRKENKENINKMNDMQIVIDGLFKKLYDKKEKDFEIKGYT